MITTLYLCACALALGQPAMAESLHGPLVPRLSRGQELVYRGSFVEEALGPQVQLRREYRLESRVFVLDTSPRGAEVAFLTVWKRRIGRPESGAEAQARPESHSVRLELAHVDAQGRVVADHDVGTRGSLTIPLEGPPATERGGFVEAPRNRVGLEETWDVAEEGRPLLTWRVGGTEAVNGTPCVKLVGLQQSEDWESPRADGAAWRRQEIVWLAPRAGVAHRVERTIEQRPPAHRDPSQRSVLRYELESTLQYPGQLCEDRRREIIQAHHWADAITPLLPRAGQVGPKPFEAVLAKIAYHLEHQPPTPYRVAVDQARRRAEAGRRGESPPAIPDDDSATAPALALGRPAPDFLATNLITKQSVRLRGWLGQPILLVFYNPASASAPEVLRFAQKLAEAHGEEFTVLGLAVAHDVELVRKQRAEWGLTFPILSGSGLRLTFGVDATPKLIVLDAAGVVRSSEVGWGQETPAAIEQELKRWLSEVTR